MRLVFIKLFLLICLNIFVCYCAPAKKKLPPAESLEFMKKYGYLDNDPNSEALYSDKGIEEAVRTLQKYGAIPQTGVIDNTTLQLMKSERCGVPDIIKTDKNRMKRYIIAAGWNKRHITYFISNWSPKLSEYSVAKNIQTALDAWGQYGHLKFTRVSSPDADIIVSFNRQYHGDSYPFDGPGMTLAHAFFPSSGMGGDIHFDDDEDWSDRENELGSEDGTDFFTVALHELGHSLGLHHSHTQSSIMFPYYRGYNKNEKFKLDYDDILGMYELYIRRPIDDIDTYTENFDRESTTEDPRRYTTSPRIVPTRRRTPPPRRRTTTEKIIPPHTTRAPRTTTIKEYYPRYPQYPSSEQTTRRFPDRRNDTTTISYEGDDESVEVHKKHDGKHSIPDNNSPSMADICRGYFDAVATLRNEIFVFKDQYLWRLTSIGRIMPGYPVPIRNMFSGLPENIKKVDAAYERPDGMIVLFTGKTFWVSDGSRFVEGPRPLSDYGLPTYLDSIDAVQTWGRNHKTYFYKQDRFWRYNEDERKMDEGYPRNMEMWRNVPQNLDAATTYKGETYFFKGEVFFKFDNDWVITTEESPMPIGEVWMGCKENYQRMVRRFK